MLRQIKYEYKHKDKILSDIFRDTEATKNLCDFLCIKLNDFDSLNGFVQEHSYNPFGFLLMSQIQVNLSIILKIYIIFTFINEFLFKDSFLEFNSK